jgi:outer membrane biosynthesis protein TonB
MREAVSDILVERAQLTSGISRMVLVSLALHLLLVASMYFAPSIWTTSASRDEMPMMITLGGAEGPDAGGMTTIAEKAVQRVAEPEEKITRPTPPAAKPPEMVAPLPELKTVPKPKPPPKPIEKPKETSSTRKPTAGAEVKSGSSRVPTGGAQVPFGGLTTGGGGTGGYRLEVTNFCCPSYLAGVVNTIKRNWTERQPVAGKNTVKFVVLRDGTITGIEVETSGGQLLDLASQRALVVTKQVAPLPREFTPPTLTIYLEFEYSR